MNNKPRIRQYKTLNRLITRLRNDLNSERFVLIFAYNGIGKTRISMEFKERGKRKRDIERDTLYFNAFTEDLFHWDNDLENDTKRVLHLNTQSRFFSGLEKLEMDTRIRRFLQCYTDFDFRIDFEKDKEEWTISFFRDERVGQSGDKCKTVRNDNIKISRGEERIFIWCFFLAIAQLAIDGEEAYGWVDYLYIDDPVSSLDDNNAIAVASHLAQLLKGSDGRIKTVISSHHTLFFNVMHNELSSTKKLKPYFLSKNESSGKYTLRYTKDTPFFHHVALLKELYEAQKSGYLYTYHFSMLRNLLEKSAIFHGFENFSACIKKDRDDVDGIIHARIINVLSHGNHSLYEPAVMVDENKGHFRKILNDFMENYQFNPELYLEDLPK